MKEQNVKEYELVRQEMITVKECITKYIGFVFGGTGLAVYGMIAVGHSKISLYEIAFTCFTLSMIISFVLLILFYKFNSHNRFAGYCKLLNHESYDYKENTSLFAWEITLERLRASDKDLNILTTIVKKIDVIDLDKTDLDKFKLTSLLTKYNTGTAKFFKGLKALGDTFQGKIKTRSWGFPPMVVSMFSVIIFGFLVGGFYATIEIHPIPNEISEVWPFLLKCAPALIVIVVQLLLWVRFILKFYDLMNGSATVDAFFWKFLPVRALVLNQLKIIPKYLFVNERLQDALDELS